MASGFEGIWNTQGMWFQTPGVVGRRSGGVVDVD